MTQKFLHLLSISLILLSTVIFASENSTQSTAPHSWNGKTVVIPVNGVIAPESYGGSGDTIIKAINDASASARTVVLQINSPGGVVDTCDKISEAILHCEVPVYALVMRKAVSGGAMLATACSKIYMVKGSRIGDIQPMMMIPGQKMDERTAEKIEADVRAIMAANASHNGYSKVLLESMVSRSYQIYEVKFKDGQREFLKQAQYDLLKKNMEQGIDKREFTEPPRIVVIKGKLLSLEAQDAKYYGLATDVVKNREAFFKLIGVEPKDIVTADIPEGKFDPLKAIDFSKIKLSNWVIMLLIICLVAGIAGSFTEASVPGFGLPGAIGIIGFTCFFYILIMHERATAFEISLFVIGIIFIVIEIVVIPGFGFAGITGIICLIAGLSLSLLPDLKSPYMQEHFWDETTFALGITFCVIVASLILFIFILERGEKIPFLKGLFLQKILPTGREAMERAREDEINDQEQIQDKRAEYLNCQGLCVTTLRPSGKVKLDSGIIIDVVTQGEMIDAQSKVVVISTEMNHIVVKGI